MVYTRLFLILVLVACMVFSACQSKEESITTTTSAATTTAFTSTTTLQTTTVGQSWHVVYAASDPGSFMLPGNLLVGLDFGREITSEEQKNLKAKSSVADGKGGHYQCLASMTCGSMDISRGGKSYHFGPCIFFSFNVSQGVSNYAFSLEGWPSVKLGDPFSKPIYSQ